METTRQQKISRLIQKDLGEIFIRESKKLFNGAMITVTTVRITRDLAIAKVYLSIFASDDKQALYEKILERNNEIRYHLGSRIKNQLRSVPILEFFIDDSLDYIENIESLLK
ncbi:30S ribosome-binding factor RbfA [candidate division KSB1 bacterium]